MGKIINSSSHMLCGLKLASRARIKIKNQKKQEKSSRMKIMDLLEGFDVEKTHSYDNNFNHNTFDDCDKTPHKWNHIEQFTEFTAPMFIGSIDSNPKTFDGFLGFQKHSHCTWLLNDMLLRDSALILWTQFISVWIFNLLNLLHRCFHVIIYF